MALIVCFLNLSDDSRRDEQFVERSRQSLNLRMVREDSHFAALSPKEELSPS